MRNRSSTICLISQNSTQPNRRSTLTASNVKSPLPNQATCRHFITPFVHHPQAGQICGGCGPLILLLYISHQDQILHKLFFLVIGARTLVTTPLSDRFNKWTKGKRKNLCQINQAEFWYNSILLSHWQLGKLCNQEKVITWHDRIEKEMHNRQYYLSYID